MIRPDHIDRQLFDAVAELGKFLGLSKSASLALALLFSADEPLSLDDVAAYTSIAKSSISVILKNLEQMGLAEAVDKPHDRRKYYQVTDHPGDAVAILVARRLDNLTSRGQYAFDARQDAGSPLQQERLEQILAIYRSLIQLATLFHVRRAAAWEDITNYLRVDVADT